MVKGLPTRHHTSSASRLVQSPGKPYKQSSLGWNPLLKLISLFLSPGLLPRGSGRALWLLNQSPMTLLAVASTETKAAGPMVDAKRQTPVANNRQPR
ncbi:hypothetical protein FRB94_013944 [Tulasnella sp. JGI-2019a]|nr:hypothetical protein FRB94_013944 [Tulasnella sp. JGI-2019a]KAG9022167.1 hypothetical protein FRB95_000612 [Tulasnella sp. JGI-2019a]